MLVENVSFLVPNYSFKNKPYETLAHVTNYYKVLSVVACIITVKLFWFCH